MALRPARRAGAVVALALAAAVLYAPVVAGMAREWWSNESFSHGFLVPVIAGYLAWQKRAALRAVARPSPAGLALVAAGLVVHALGLVAEVEFLSHLSLLITIGGLLVTAWGRRGLRVLAFPYAFLLFLVPWPDTLVEFLSFPMQLLSAKFAAMSVGLLGIPARRDGVDIHIGSYLFSVGAPCSGMRSLVALLALSALMAYLLRGPMLRRMTLFVLGLPLALLANMIRIACILLLAHAFGVAVAEGFFHKFSGMLVFLVACLGLLAAGRALGLRTRGDTPSAPAEALPTGSLSRRAGLVTWVMAALCLGLAAASWAGRAEPVARRVDFSVVPATFPGWRSRDLGPLDRVSAEMLQPDDYLSRLYRRADGYPVQVSVVVGHRKQTFHSPGFCLLGGGWNIMRKAGVRLRGAGEANEFWLQRENEERVVVYWYASFGETTPSWVTFQYRLLRNRLLGRPRSGALVRLVAPVAGSTKEAEAVTAELAERLAPGLRQVVEGDRPTEMRHSR